jgi:subtilisin family serine protease
MARRLRILGKNLFVVLSLGVAVPGVAGAAAGTDPMLAQQWALADPSAIGAQEAWTQSTGAGVLVAVLDTGVQVSHPDLAGSVWTNPGEIPANGRDDDANGIVDDVHGANMFDMTANVDDDNGHGTHVAGIIAARHGNAIGGSGLAPDATILPVKVLDSQMAGTTDTLARGIRYAVDEGARILNVSVNTDSATQSVSDAVHYAAQHGAIVVASAGNNDRNIDLLPSYPASISDPAVISVAAETDQGLLWQLSNTGLLSVDLAAPGEHIASTTRGSSYQSRTGTSAAAPFVAASLALLASARPDLPPGALRNAILTTTRRTSILSRLLGNGRLDVAAAMHSVLPGPAWRTTPAPTSTLTPASTAASGAPTLRLTSTRTARAGARIKLRWKATHTPTVTRWRVSVDNRAVTTVVVATTSATRRINHTGRHTWRVTGYHGHTRVITAARTIRILRRH